MTTISARRHGNGRGYWRLGWVPIVDDAEIQGVKFATREEAIGYARRAAEYLKDETIREVKRQKK